jgi:hypothetical protein
VCGRTETGICPGALAPKTGLNLAHKLMLLVFVAIKVKLISGRDENTPAVLVHIVPRDAAISDIRKQSLGKADGTEFHELIPRILVHFT